MKVNLKTSELYFWLERSKELQCEGRLPSILIIKESRFCFDGEHILIDCSKII